MLSIAVLIRYRESCSEGFKKLMIIREDSDVLSKNAKTRRWVDEVILSVTKNSNGVIEYSNISLKQDNAVFSLPIKNKTADYSEYLVPRERFELSTIRSSAERSPSLSYLGGLRLILSSPF
ncbi:MAG: hypothetical protein QG670_814 [Thermoproteota archaeon]|nr:hypothetical protein [Thermoproteota archaeon]